MHLISMRSSLTASLPEGLGDSGGRITGAASIATAPVPVLMLVLAVLLLPAAAAVLLLTVLVSELLLLGRTALLLLVPLVVGVPNKLELLRSKWCCCC